MKFMALTLLALSFSLLLAGCAGSDSQGKGQPAPTGSNAPSGGSNQDAQQKTAAQGAAASDDSVSKELVKLFGMKKLSGWQVQYNIKSTSSNSAQQDGKMAIYFKDEKTMRTDIEGQGTNIRTYLLVSEIDMCTFMQSKWSCYNIGSAPDTSSDKVEKELEANIAKYTVEKLPPRTIAGASATCYRINDVESSTVEYCFAPEGVPLYTHMVAPDSDVTMEATSYKMSVADSDFVLPAKAGELNIPSGPAS